jgi:uncharacterized repeat protein (TIGR01451 family)
VNTATVRPPQRVGDPNLADNVATDTDAPHLRADLSIKKSHLGILVAGSPVTYTVVVRNAGPSDVSAAHVTDELPPSILDAKWSCSTPTGGAICASATGTGSLRTTANLPNDASLTYTIVGRVAADYGGTTLDNRAQIAAPEGVTDGDLDNNTSLDSATSSRIADLAVGISDDVSTFTPGGRVSYRVTVTNAGPSAVTAVPIEVSGPGLSNPTWGCLTSVGSSCASASGSGERALVPVNLMPGGSATITVAATTDPSMTTELAVTATAVLPLGVTDPVLANNTARDTDTAVPIFDLSIVQTSDAAAGDVGGVATLILSVTNQGPSTATGVVVDDPLPDGLVLVSATPSAGTCSGALSCSIGQIVPGSTVTIRVRATAVRAGVVANLARVRGTSADSNPANDSSTYSLTSLPKAAIQAQARLEIVDVGPKRGQAGRRATFAMTVRNVSVVTARSVALETVLPAGMTVSSRQAAARGRVRLHMGTVRWELGNLAPGAGRRLTMTVTVSRNAKGTLVHRALARAENAPVASDSVAISVLPRRSARPRVTG